MTELLDRIHAEIRERLEARRPAAEEYERLEAALAALGPPSRAPQGAEQGEIVKDGETYALPGSAEAPVAIPVATDAEEPPALAA